MPSCELAEPSILCKEKLLTDRLKLDTSTPTWNAYIEKHEKDTQLADAVCKWRQDQGNLASRILDRDGYLGKGLFLNFQFPEMVVL